MKTKIKNIITSILASIASIFIIVASILQWTNGVYYKTAREAKYTINYYNFLKNSSHFAHYIENQNEVAENESE